MKLTSLSFMSREGQDIEVCRILCFTANRLHTFQKQTEPQPQLIPLHDWFSALKPATRKYGGILTHCFEISEKLLSTQRDVVTLHGDLHHGDVLDFGASGWLAIDPR